MIAVAAAGAIVGDNLGYWLIGRLGGRALFIAWATAVGLTSYYAGQVGDLSATIPLGTYPRVAYPVQLAAGAGAVWVAVH